MVQSVELLFDAATEEALRAQWRALAVAGLPSQHHHTAASNRPHVTVGVTSELDPAVEPSLSAVAGRLPLPCVLSGAQIFEHRSDILVRAVQPSESLLALHAEVAGLLSGSPGLPANLLPGAWLPHVTLARRLRGAQTASALALLDWTPLAGRFVAIRRWDGDARLEWRLG